ncbi:FHA domain-containing protein [Amycolatopsis sp. cmx-4-68]|uniref:FHA domain-containing protein n=1 Tax=Amycolatopsis sp. cmx-4-68 TaxID=2790938 RepID=UPI0039795C6D
MVGNNQASPPVTILTIREPALLRDVRLNISEGEQLLGRLLIHDDSMSRRHARTWWHSGSLWIEDCGSTNGTFVEGEQVTAPTRLVLGSRVRLGNVLAVVEQAATRPAPISGRGDGHYAGPWLTQPLDVTSSQTTRCLCAATHLDESFCRVVLRETVAQPMRAVAPAYGVDLAAVARHALAASRRRLIRDAILAVVLLTCLVIWAQHLLPVRELHSAEIPALLLTTFWPSLPLGLGLAWLVVTTENAAMLWLLVGRLTGRNVDVSNVAPPASRRAQHQLERLERLRRGNLVVFRDYQPFVGSGTPTGSWTLAVDLTKGVPNQQDEGRRKPKPFSAHDLHMHLATRLRQLELPGLSVSERLFINGNDVRGDDRLLPRLLAPPVEFVDPAVLLEAMNTPDSRARTYLCVETSGWRGQLTSTVFLRAVRIRGSLYLECSSFILPPLQTRFHAIDRLSGCDAADRLLKAAGYATIHTFPLLMASLVRVANVVTGAGYVSRVEHRQRRAITEDRVFNYGAAASLRELAGATEFRRYYQEVDSDMYEQVVQEALLQETVEFLTLHDVDTGQVRQLQTTINNGNVSHIKIGKGANYIMGSNNAIGKNASVSAK